jgi:hypothetical protein
MTAVVWITSTRVLINQKVFKKRGEQEEEFYHLCESFPLRCDLFSSWVAPPDNLCWLTEASFSVRFFLIFFFVFKLKFFESTREPACGSIWLRSGAVTKSSVSLSFVALLMLITRLWVFMFRKSVRKKNLLNPLEITQKAQNLSNRLRLKWSKSPFSSPLRQSRGAKTQNSANNNFAANAF